MGCWKVFVWNTNGGDMCLMVPLYSPHAENNLSEILLKSLAFSFPKQVQWWRPFSASYTQSCQIKSDDSKIVSVISNRKVRVQDVYKISQLITGCSDSWPTSLHLPAFHRMPPPLPPPGVCNLAKVSWRKWYHHTTRFMRDSLPYLPVYSIHWLPPRSGFFPWWFTKQEPIYWVSRRAWAQQLVSCDRC